MLNLNLKKKETLYKSIETDVIADFYRIGTNKSNKNYRFAKVDSNFNAFLPYLRDGATKLYLHYVLAANNESGDSWHSIDAIGKKIDTTDRSIGNWNNELEDLGLIYRVSNGKKSKTTYVLPLTGFAFKMSIEKINQIFDELSLFDSNAQTRVFGRFHSLTKLYMRTNEKEELFEVTCVCLEKRNMAKTSVVNKMTIFLYYTEKTEDDSWLKKVSNSDCEDKVIVVQEKDPFKLGKKILQYGPSGYSSYFVNGMIAISDDSIYDIMSQLIDDIDTADLKVITKN